MAALTATALALTGCGKQIIGRAEFPPKTTLALTTSRCQGQQCTCRALDAEDGQAEVGIPAGHKRFEFRLPRTGSSIWVSVQNKGVFYKHPDQIEPSCFYVDLKPGEHRVTVDSSNQGSATYLQTGLTIYEYGKKKGNAWYRSLRFVCGTGANACTQEEMEIWRGFQAKLPKGVLNSCGSVMVRGVQHAGDREHKQAQEYLNLTLNFTLKVYKFEPYRSPHSADCRPPKKNR